MELLLIHLLNNSKQSNSYHPTLLGGHTTGEGDINLRESKE